MSKHTFGRHPVRLANVSEIAVLSILENSSGMSAQEMQERLYAFGAIGDDGKNFHTTMMKFRDAGWVRTTRIGRVAIHDITPQGRNRLMQCARVLERVGFPVCIPTEIPPAEVETVGSCGTPA